MKDEIGSKKQKYLLLSTHSADAIAKVKDSDLLAVEKRESLARKAGLLRNRENALQSMRLRREEDDEFVSGTAVTLWDSELTATIVNVNADHWVGKIIRVTTGYEFGNIDIFTLEPGTNENVLEPRDDFDRGIKKIVDTPFFRSFHPHKFQGKIHFRFFNRFPTPLKDTPLPPVQDDFSCGAYAIYVVSVVLFNVSVSCHYEAVQNVRYNLFNYISNLHQYRERRKPTSAFQLTVEEECGGTSPICQDLTQAVPESSIEASNFFDMEMERTSRDENTITLNESNTQTRITTRLLFEKW